MPGGGYHCRLDPHCGSRVALQLTWQLAFFRTNIVRVHVPRGPGRRCKASSDVASEAQNITFSVLVNQAYH